MAVHTPMSEAGLGQTFDEADEMALGGKLELDAAKGLIRTAWNRCIHETVADYDGVAMRLARDSAALSAYIRKHTTKYAELDIARDEMSEDTRKTYDALLRDRGLLLFLQRHLDLRSNFQFGHKEDEFDASSPDEVMRKRMEALKLLILAGASADELLEVIGAN